MKSLCVALLAPVVCVGVVVTAGCGCGSKAPANPEDGTDTSLDPDATPIMIPESCEGGTITYGAGGKHFRTTLSKTVTTESLSDRFDGLSAGKDNWVSVSPDGEYYLLESNRFDAGCRDWNCLAVVKADMSSGEALKIAGQLVHGDNYGAIASGGTRIVYPMGDGPHPRDLYVSNKSGTTWGAPKLLTAASPHPYNLQPAISADGSKVVFDCGEDPYGQPPTSICEVNTDGTNFRVVWTPEQGGVGAAGRSNVALHHPDYFENGSIVFEADWNGEQIWHLTGNGPPKVIAKSYSNDNSPCVLNNQCIVSIWLERPGSSGTHEIKIMDAEGGNFSMVRTDIDVVDTGTGCGG